MPRSLSTLAGSNTNSYHSCVNTGNCAASRVVLLPSLVQFYSEFMQLNIQQKTQGFPLCRLLGDLSLCRFVSPVLSPPFQIPYPQTDLCLPNSERLPALLGFPSCSVIQKRLQEESQGNCRDHLFAPLLLGMILCCLHLW